ncbi:hemolysin III family protein [Rubripirellula amarantea]|uniref:Hemolysin-III related n=1 Tax=Rubripirellula amarantea TaxID=2527999 RepID=A0A5C5WSZ9_9BACT|nr:hemolysin III family protein [Rubripirellula amarantea]MDA8743015.1 hemolysin III family protein [Rubripirellula amarantea]TWT53638.1 hemolysin-III related [Rubripirellula amarantea]
MPTDQASPLIELERVDEFGEPPWQAGQEWANAITHGIAAIATLVLGYFLVLRAQQESTGMAIACAAYIASVFGTFFFSTLSHLVKPSPLLNVLRSWDQAMIYAMISGTYTPIVYRFATDGTRTWLLWAIWIAAGAGFFHKVAMKHRVNSSGTISYLLLGWLPAIPLFGQVPSVVVTWMFIGGIFYTLGVVLLVNDRKVRYLHAGWHLMVMTAAFSHYWTIFNHVAPATLTP